MISKFTKVTAEKFIKNSNDAQVAQLGHLNALLEIFTPGSTVNSTSGNVKIISGTISPAQWTTLNTAPIPVYTTTATNAFLPLGGLIYYSYDAVSGVPPCETFGLYYNIVAPALIIDASSWTLAPTNGVIQFVPASTASPAATAGDILYLGSGSNPDCPGTIMDLASYFIFGIELIN
jgi:hypothetical protein